MPEFMAETGSGQRKSRLTAPVQMKCRRCGKPRMDGPSTLCVECAATCVVCGKPTRLLKKGRGTASYKGYAESRCAEHEWKTLKCSKCGKPRDGNHHSYCVSCNREYQNDWYHAHKDERRAAQQAVRKGKRRVVKRTTMVR